MNYELQLRTEEKQVPQATVGCARQQGYPASVLTLLFVGF